MRGNLVSKNQTHLIEKFYTDCLMSVKDSNLLGKNCETLKLNNIEETKSTDSYSTATDIILTENNQVNKSSGGLRDGKFDNEILGDLIIKIKNHDN